MKQGEKLLLLIRRSGKQVKEVAEHLDILPTSLSRMFKSEILTTKIKKKAATFFEIAEDYFDDDKDMQEVDGGEVINEPDLTYLPIEQRIRALTAQKDNDRQIVIQMLMDELSGVKEENEELKKEKQQMLDIIEQLSKLK